METLVARSLPLTAATEDSFTNTPCEAIRLLVKKEVTLQENDGCDSTTHFAAAFNNTAQVVQLLLDSRATVCIVNG